MARSTNTKVPIIEEVLKPSDGQYIVQVRMPIGLAANFPDEPWGTLISEIGLPEKEWSKYEGYELVDINRADRDTEDLYWVFQKLDGPEWKTTVQGSADLVPNKFKRFVKTTQTRQVVDPETLPSEIAGETRQSVVEQEDNTGRALKTDTTEEIILDEEGLVGRRKNPDCTITTTTETLVDDGTEPDAGEFVYSSSVAPLGNGKSIKTTEVLDKWPTGGRKSRGQSLTDSIPAKFRSAVQTLINVTTKVLTGGELPEVPELTGDQSRITLTKTSECRYEEEIQTEEFTEETDPLEGELYGQIVTRSTSETLVAEGTAADSGINIIESTVVPIGNGRAVKRTEEASDGWPSPVTQTLAIQAPSIPSKLRRMLNRVIRTFKINPADAELTLGADEVAISFKQETPDRTDKTVETETVNLDGLPDDDIQVEVRPFVKITQTTRTETASVIPATGVGSSRQIYDSGVTKVFENMEQSSEAVTGSAGIEIDARPFVKVTSDKEYRTAPDVTTDAGSSRVVFDDGETKVYEVSERTPAAKTGPAGTEIDERPFVTITKNKSYELTSNITSPTGSSRVIFNEAGVIVYEVTNEDATGKYGTVGQNQRGLQWGTIFENVKYAANGDLGGKNGNSRIIWTNGVVTIYEVRTEDAVSVNGNEFISSKTTTPLYVRTVRTSFGLAPISDGDNSSSAMVYQNGSTVVYRNDRITIAPKAARTYNTLVRSSVPSVLKAIRQKYYKRRDGSLLLLVDVQVSEGYTGVFSGRVTEYYTEKSPTGSFKPVTFRPKPIKFDGFYGNFSIGATLHSGFVITEETGTIDPIFKWAKHTVTIQPTTPVDIPTGEVPYAQTVTPFENGYIVKEIYITYA